MSYFTRTRSNGRAIELRIKHKLLPKPFYATFDNEAEAKSFAEAAERSLAKGIVPEGLASAPKFDFVDIAGAIAAYIKAVCLKPSTCRVLLTIQQNIGPAKVSAIDYAWAEEWVRSQKFGPSRAPSTIRHHVGALRGCLDWVVNKYPSYLSENYLWRLPRGFASYNGHEQKLLAVQGLDAPVDVERDRRVPPDEEERIVAVLQRRISEATDPNARAYHRAALLMFHLALETALRMRETYTLEVSQVDLPKKTLFLTVTKNGDRREVPLCSKTRALLADHGSFQPARGKAPLLFPFWNGDQDDAVLAATTSRVSAYFATVFSEAGCVDLVYHDTRHEGCCRLMLKSAAAGKPYNQTELSRATGHRDPRMCRRYLSLLGSELADRLG